MNLLPKFKYSEAARRAGLCLPLGLLAARDVTMPDLQRTVETEKAQTVERVQSEARAAVARRIARFDDFFAAKGYSCPLPQQLRSVGKKGFPRISPGVDMLLVCEMATGVLMGIQDLDTVEGELIYDVARAGETFQGLRGVVTCRNDEIVLRDDLALVASYFQGPDRRINITANTTSLLFFIFSAPHLDQGAIADGLNLAASIVSKHAIEIEVKTFSE